MFVRSRVMIPVAIISNGSEAAIPIVLSPTSSDSIFMIISISPAKGGINNDESIDDSML